jgi:integrase
MDKRESSWIIEEKSMHRHLLPALGQMPVVQVRRADIVSLISLTTAGSPPPGVVWDKNRFRKWGGPGSARILWANVNTLFNWGLERGLVDANPAAKIRFPKRAFVGKRLSLEQTKAALRAIDELMASGKLNPNAGHALRLLIYTGARKAEICQLTWSEIQWADRMIVLPPARTKCGNRTGERRIPLSGAAIELLRAIPRTSSYVFQGSRTSTALASANYNWKRVLEHAGLPQIRVHDIRHTFASIAADTGESLINISSALGHSNLATTQIYLHHRQSQVIDMSDRFGQLFEPGRS